MNRSLKKIICKYFIRSFCLWINSVSLFAIQQNDKYMREKEKPERLLSLLVTCFFTYSKLWRNAFMTVYFAEKKICATGQSSCLRLMTRFHAFNSLCCVWAAEIMTSHLIPPPVSQLFPLWMRPSHKRTACPGNPQSHGRGHFCSRSRYQTAPSQTAISVLGVCNYKKQSI